MITLPVEVYTDGSCVRNPGAGGYGCIIRYWDTPEGSTLPQAKEIEFSQGYRLTTNNRMELLAAINALQKTIDMKDNELNGMTQINIFSDSEYLCNAINQRWVVKWSENNWMTSSFGGKQPKPVRNKDLWELILNIQGSLQSMGITITYTHVDGHSGHEFNERCDKLAFNAASGTNHIIDEEYEKTANVMNRR